MERYFNKVVVDGCDRLKVRVSDGSDWVEISMNHDNTGHEMGSITLRSEQHVRDLHYLLGEILRRTE